MLTKRISKIEANLLNSLTGQEFRFIGGANLAESLVSDFIIIGTDKAAVSIFGDLEEEASGAGSSDDFSYFVIRESAEAELSETRKSGNMYLIDKRSSIRGVSIVRDQMQFRAHDEDPWDLAWDSAIIFTLDSGSIAISFLSLSMEALRVDFFEELRLEDLPRPSNPYEESLVSHIEVERKVLSL
jgi:hypothetical protein